MAKRPADTTAPTVVSIAYGTNDGTLKAGDTVTLIVTMSEVVNVSGTPTITLANGGVATYTSGTRSNALVFTYTVQAGQDTADLSTALTAAFTGTIADAARNAVVASGFNGINPTGTLVVDTRAPTVTISDDTAGTASGPVTYTLTFDQAVTGLAAGDSTVTNGTVTSVSGSGNVYTVVVTPTSDFVGDLGLSLAAGAVTDAAGNASLAATAASQAVDTVTPTVTITDDADGTTNGDVTYTLTFSEEVTGLAAGDFTVTNGTITSVTGSGSSYTVVVSPDADVEDDVGLTLAASAVTDLVGNGNAETSATAQAVDTLAPDVTITDDTDGTAAGSVTYTLEFAEDVTGLAAGDFTVTNGTVTSVSGSGRTYTVVVAPSASVEGNMGLTLDAGAVTDAVGNASASASAAAQAVDTRSPTVTAIAYGTNDGTIKAGETVTFSVSFSEAVTVTGTPTLALANGGSATYTGGTGTSTLTFSYTATAGQDTADLAAAASSALAGSIADAVGNALVATGANGVNPTGTLKVDTVAPTVTGISYGTNDGTLKAGETVTLNVTFSEAVTVTGTPTLALANGGSATYAGGSGTGTLSFSYTVAAGQNAADLVTAASAALAGTITDIAGNAAVTTGANGINPTGTLVVDTVAPTVVTFSPADAATGVAVGSNIVLTFSEAIARGTGTITILSGSATGTVVESFSVATSTRLVLTGSTLTIDPTSNLANGTTYFVVLDVTAITDAAGNAYAGTSTYDFVTQAAGNVINGTANADTLTGTTGIDLIYGLGGNDTVTGAAGTDTMDGGEGSDLYIVALSFHHAAAEFADTGTTGTDEVRFTSTTAGSTLTLYAGDTGIERAVIGTGTTATAVTSGTTALNINASALASGIVLVGNAGANVLTGGSGNDTLLGGAGNDTLAGGLGFDYADYSTATASVTVNLGLTTAQVTGGAGSDTLSGIEGVIGGAAADTLTGTASDNVLIGNAGNDTLSASGGNDQLRGGNGNDTLTGGTGNDWFIFDFAANTTSNRDTITDFVSGTDELQFSKAVFAGLNLGDLTADAFRSGAGITTAGDATDRLIYNTTTGVLYYDADGTGATAAVQVALLGATTHPTLLYTDITVIA